MKKGELTKRIMFAVMILVIYRFGTYVPLPSIDLAKMAEFAKVAKSGIFGMFNVFSGGSIARISIFGLGIMPYITSSIIMQLMAASVPALKQLKTDGGEAGQRKITLYTRYLTILVGIIQGFMFAGGFVSMGLYDGTGTIFMFKLTSAIIMLTSTMILIWLGELCTNKGIGNGTSLIIFAGIVAEAPRDLVNVFSLSKSGNISVLMLLLLFAVFAATIAFVVFFERANRLIYIQYPRQAQNFIGKKNQMPQENFLPLRVNTAGVVPPIFASALMLLPATFITVLGNSGSGFGDFVARHFTHGTVMYAITYVVLIVFFSFFYNSVIFDSDEIANNLKRSNVFIPGCRPGTATSELLRKIMMRLSVVGAAYLSVVCLVPEFLSPIYGYSFLLGGTGVLIVVNVIIDTVINIQTSMLSAKYEKALKKYDKR
jgi:preprotein translocase subunit SecY